MMMLEGLVKPVEIIYDYSLGPILNKFFFTTKQKEKDPIFDEQIDYGSIINDEVDDEVAEIKISDVVEKQSTDAILQDLLIQSRIKSLDSLYSSTYTELPKVALIYKKDIKKEKNCFKKLMVKIKSILNNMFSCCVTKHYDRID